MSSTIHLEALTETDDIRDAPVDFLRDPVDRQQIQATLTEHVRSFRL